MKNLLFLFLFCLFNKITFSQSTNYSKLDSLFDIIEANEKGMGAVTISKNDTTSYNRFYGFQNIESKIRNNENTRFRIASVSKMFTACIVMMLVEENKLSVNTKLADFFPNIKYSDSITIDNLLRHTSGITNYLTGRDYFNPTWVEKSITKDSLLARIEKGGSVFMPNQKIEYSNSNYVLLTFIVEELLNRPFADILNDRICKPLGLKATSFGELDSSSFNKAISYQKEINWEKSSNTNLSVAQGAGAIISTTSELNLFIYGLFNEKLISKSSLNYMLEINDRYGAGIFEYEYANKIAYGHSGGVDGFQTIAVYFPKEKLSFSLCSNGVVTPLHEILNLMINIYLGNYCELPVYNKNIEYAEEEIIKYIGVYTEPTIGLKIHVFNRESQLFAQVFDQSEFPLFSYKKGQFEYEQAGLTLLFEEKRLVLKQGEGEYVLLKE